MSADRLLIFGGIALIIAGMIFGDVFAVFVLHQNAGRIGQALMSAADAVADKDVSSVNRLFAEMGGLLENRGTKVDTHVHIIDFGYLALLLALVQPYVALSNRARKRLAIVFLGGAIMLPVSVFLIHYVGLAGSPLESIGWASIVADFGGLLVIVASIGELSGVFRYFRGSRRRSAEEPLPVRTWATRVLLSGGTLLILTGFIHGAFYAVVDLQKHEAQDQAALETMISASVAQQTLAARNMKDAHLVVEGYGLLQAEKAVNIAAHSHIIEFGLLSMLLAFLQAYVVLSEPVRRAMVTLMLTGSFVLPVFVLLEIKLGVIAAGMADFGGLLVIVALIGMALGALRGGNQVPDTVHGARV